LVAAETAVRGTVAEPGGVLVDTADVPGGGQLHLLRHGSHFEIMFGNEQLMGSWSYRSEQALATLALGGLGGQPQVLIGGLGMGFTLAAARASLPAGARIIVAELVPQIVTWAAGHLRHLFGGSLDDPRVSVEVRDVHDLIVEQPAGFDAILLDVDNGPDGLISLANERLYSNWGLRVVRSALRPSGVLAIWSALSGSQLHLSPEGVRLRRRGGQHRHRQQRGQSGPYDLARHG